MGLLIPFNPQNEPETSLFEGEESEILSNSHKRVLKKRLQQIAKLITIKDLPRIYHDTPSKLASIKTSKEYVSKMAARIHLLHQMLFDNTFCKTKSVEKILAAGLMYFIHSEDFLSDDIPGLGYVDDAYVISTTWEKAQSEIKAYLSTRQLDIHVFI